MKNCKLMLHNNYDWLEFIGNQNFLMRSSFKLMCYVMQCFAKIHILYVTIVLSHVRKGTVDHNNNYYSF